MTNTYVERGECTDAEIFCGIKKGLFITNVSGGNVNTLTGDFNFKATEAYLIENGKVTKPVKGAMLIGNYQKFLKDVEMVGDDLELTIGACIASSGKIEVGVGQPKVRVSEILIGGF